MNSKLNALPYWFFLHIFWKLHIFLHIFFLQCIMHMTVSIAIMHVTISVVAMYVTVSSSNFIFLSLTDTLFSENWQENI